jgi:hypothetical protein
MSTHPRDVLGKTLDDLFIVRFQCSPYRFHVAISIQQQHQGYTSSTEWLQYIYIYIYIYRIIN